MGGKRAAGALLALSLLWVGSASPLADAQGRAADSREEPAPAAVLAGAPAEAVPEHPEETVSGLVLTEIAEPPGSLTELRAAEVGRVPEEGRDAACWAVYRELLPLGESGSFQGEEPASRGEAVGALYRLSGILVQVDSCPYPDVPEEYQAAVAWADSVGVSNGAEEGRFAPLSPVTRSQLAVMLFRFAAWRGENVESAVSWNGEKVPAYAEEALNWVMDRGLYGGMTDHGLYPDLPVSRLQLACALARMQESRDPLAGALVLPEGGGAGVCPQKHEELSRAIAAAARRHGAVGVQVAVIEDGAVTDAFHYGWAVQGSVPMTDAHKLRTASLSKVAVGLAAMALSEEGKVNLDESIGKYWGFEVKNPQYPDKPVSLRTLLTHTSSIFNAGDSESRSYESVKSRLRGSGFLPGHQGIQRYTKHPAEGPQIGGAGLGFPALPFGDGLVGDLQLPGQRLLGQSPLGTKGFDSCTEFHIEYLLWCLYLTPKAVPCPPTIRQL